MPARAVARARATDIPPDVYVAIARDPKLFDAKLDEWEKRRKAAVDAEGMATVRITEAERAEKQSKGQLEQLAERSQEIRVANEALDA